AGVVRRAGRAAKAYLALQMSGAPVARTGGPPGGGLAAGPGPAAERRHRWLAPPLARPSFHGPVRGGIIGGPPPPSVALPARRRAEAIVDGHPGQLGDADAARADVHPRPVETAG